MKSVSVVFCNGHPPSTPGTSIWGGEDVYACDTLDTMYVRPFARRQGYSLALLHTLTSELPPGDHLGLSHPISLSMCKGK